MRPRLGKIGASNPAPHLRRWPADVMEPAPEAATAVLFADLDQPGSPGCSVGVSRQGEVVFEDAFGFADLERAIPLSPATVFDVGSVAKQVTAGSALLLVEDGRLSLADEVRAYVPELPDYCAGITIDHLIHHTGGLPDYIDLLLAGGADLTGVTTTEDALAALRAAPRLRFAPGSRFAYTNSGYFLLGLIVERVSGRGLRAFADERFFGPLGMDHSLFRECHDEAIPGLARAYAQSDGESFTPWTSGWEQVGDGALHTTVGDLLVWADNLRTGAVGGEGWRSAMLTPGRLADGTTTSYGGGLYLEQHRGELHVWHSGQWAGYRAALHLLPDSGLAVAVACNLANVDPASRALQVLDVWHSRNGAIPSWADSSERRNTRLLGQRS
jgi:CubicO group peptidase (beta-lactamase class C family)